MTPADAQQRRLLERLREAGDEAVAFAELHASGIAFPAAVVAELELNGYVIERVHDHGHLVGVADRRTFRTNNERYRPSGGAGSRTRLRMLLRDEQPRGAPCLLPRSWREASSP